MGGGGGQFLDFMGGHSCYEGGHRAHGGVPPLGKTLGILLLRTESPVSWILASKLYVNSLCITNLRYDELYCEPNFWFPRHEYPRYNELLREMIVIA